MDGVLVDSTAAIARVWARWAARHNMDPVRIVALAHGRTSLAAIQDLLPEDSPEDHLEENRWMERGEIEDVADVVALPGAHALLACVPPARRAVVTSATRPLAEVRLRAAGLWELVSQTRNRQRHPARQAASGALPKRCRLSSTSAARLRRHRRRRLRHPSRKICREPASSPSAPPATTLRSSPPAPIGSQTTVPLFVFVSSPTPINFSSNSPTTKFRAYPKCVKMRRIVQSLFSCSKEKSVMNRPFRLTVLCALLLLLASTPSRAFAQEKESKPAEKPAEPPPAPPKEESMITDHSIKIGSQTIPYKATVGSLLLKNEKDEPAALIFYTSYVRSDVKDLSQRPVAFIYNGGPGSSSLWLHMGSFGPKRVATINAGVTPPAPYTLEDNPNCLLDKADLVFIDPVGTGFSRAVGKAQDKDFWGVDQDARSLAQFIQSYVSRNNRWNSSKFLIGESYGTFRNAVLANVLQSRYTLYLNGLVMISSVWDLGTISFYPGEDLSYIVYLPSYAATAWYHKLLTDRPDNLNAFLEEASKFAKGEYADALLKGSALTDAEKSAVAKKYARFTGLSEDYVLKSNLRVKLFQFMQELQRSRGLTTGRLDARFLRPHLQSHQRCRRLRSPGNRHQRRVRRRLQSIRPRRAEIQSRPRIPRLRKLWR